MFYVHIRTQTDIFTFFITFVLHFIHQHGEDMFLFQCDHALILIAAAGASGSVKGIFRSGTSCSKTLISAFLSTSWDLSTVANLKVLQAGQTLRK